MSTVWGSLVALLPFTMAISFMEIMLMQTLSIQTHGDIYLGDCFTVLKMIQTFCARKSWRIVLWRIWVTSHFIKVWIETCIRIRLQWGFLYLQFHAESYSVYSCKWFFFNQVVLSTYNRSGSMLTAKRAILPHILYCCNSLYKQVTWTYIWILPLLSHILLVYICFHFSYWEHIQGDLKNMSSFQWFSTSMSCLGLQLNLLNW